MMYPADYIGIAQGYHKGLSIDLGYDEAKNKNMPIYASTDGIVKAVEKQTTGGNTIFIDYPNLGIRICYAHLEKVLVKKDQTVGYRTQIGTMGKTGVASGEHCHVGIYPITDKINYGNATIDPFNIFEVYEGQRVGPGTKIRYASKIKYHKDGPLPNKEKKVCAVGGLNVRNKPSILGKKIGALKNQTKVTVYNEMNGWSRIGTDKWVSSKYLK